VLKKLLTKIKAVGTLRAEKLYWAIGFVITSLIYYKNSLGRGSTYCNVSIYDLLDSRCNSVWWNKIKVGETTEVNLPMGGVISAYNYDISPVLPGRSYNNILNAPIPFVYQKCIDENGRGTRLVTPEKAQSLANAGIPVMIISKKYNHVAVVCPDLVWSIEKGKMVFQNYDPDLGCFTGNAGENNDYMYMSDKRGFGAINWKDEEILYVQFKIAGKPDFEDVF